MFIVSAPAQFRRKALKVACLGGVVVWMLAGDPRILERFVTSFKSTEDLDNSAASRFEFWTAGLMMVADHPLGAGGDGFHDAYGAKYLSKVRGAESASRSVHNGFINEACDWGLQGFVLRITLLGTVLLLLRRAGVTAMRNDDWLGTMLACALIGGISGFMAQSVFGDFLDNEWGYWITACAIGHATVYARQGIGRANQAGLYVLVPGAVPVQQSHVHSPVTASAGPGT